MCNYAPANIVHCNFNELVTLLPAPFSRRAHKRAQEVHKKHQEEVSIPGQSRHDTCIYMFMYSVHIQQCIVYGVMHALR